MNRDPDGWSRKLKRLQGRRIVQPNVRAGIGHALATHGSIEDLGHLGQPLHATGCVEIVDAQPPMVVLVVAGADADVEAAGRDVIDGQRLPGENHGVAQGCVGDESSDPDPLRVGGDRSQCRPGLENGQPVRDRLVCQPNGIEPDPLRKLRIASQLGI